MKLAADDCPRRTSDAAPLRFFVAGVSKAGTTALYGFLRQHPQLFLCPIKEPSFFAAEDFLAIDDPVARRTIRRRALAVERWRAGELSEIPDDGFAFDCRSYAALFSYARGEHAIGDCSTTYWYAPRAASAIAERYPDARVVLILRNPADRFFSQYLTTRMSAPLASCRDYFAMARDRTDGWGWVLDMGRYATNLKRFFSHFQRWQFQIHLYEDFCRDPRSVCTSIFEFLGVAADVPIDLTARTNEPRLPRWPALQALRSTLGGSYSLHTRLPRPLSHALRRIYFKPRSRESMSLDDRRIITEFYRDEILETSSLIGRDLTPWLAC